MHDVGRGLFFRREADERRALIREGHRFYVDRDFRSCAKFLDGVARVARTEELGQITRRRAGRQKLREVEIILERLGIICLARLHIAHHVEHRHRLVLR